MQNMQEDLNKLINEDQQTESLLLSYELPEKILTELLELGKLHDRPSEFDIKAIEFLNNNKDLCRPAEELTVKQAVALVWLLLAWGGCVIANVNRLCQEVKELEIDEINNENLIEDKKNAYNIAAAQLLPRTAGTAALCRRLTVELPEDLLSRVREQLRLAGQCVWAQGLRQETAPDFTDALEKLGVFRERLNKHREVYYKKATETPLPKLTSPSKPMEFLPKQWAEENQAFFIRFTAHLFELAEAVSGIKLPPCAFVALGSLCKQEMSLFSDIEYLILVEKLTPQIRKDILQVCRVFNFLVACLGETPDSDLTKQTGLVTGGHGYCIDEGGNAPVVNSKFINTPKEFAAFMTKKGQIDPTLLNVLFSVCKIKGEERLIIEYQTELKKATERCIVDSVFPFWRQYWYQQCAVKLMEQNSINFNIHTQNKKAVKSNRPVFNVKEDLLRPVSQLIIDLCLFHGLITDKMTTWERLDLLRDKGILSKENHCLLYYVLNTAYHLRLKAHGFYGEEREDLYPDEPQKSKDKLYIEGEIKEALLNCFRVLLPLFDMAKKFHNAVKNNLTNKPKLFSTTACYEKNLSVEARSYERTGEIKEAAKLFARALRLDPGDLELRCHYVNFLLRHQQQIHAKHQNSPQQKPTMELEEHSGDTDTQIGFLAERLAKTGDSAEVYLNAYRLLAQPAQLQLVAKLVTLAQEPQHEFLYPIVKALLAEHDEPEKNSEWQDEQRQWHKQLLLMVEQASPEEAKKRTGVISPLFPANENWVLKQNIQQKLFNEKNEFIAQEYKGNHKVFRLQEDGADVFLKFRPEMPGMTSLIALLHRLVFGRGTGQSEFLQFVLPNGQAVPVSVSKTVHGETLGELLKNIKSEKEIIEKIDLESYCELFIMTLLTKPEDDLDSNIIVDKNGRLTNIDFDHNLFPLWEWKDDPENPKKTKLVLNLKSILLCLRPLLQQKIPASVIKRFLTLDPKKIIDKWLYLAQIQNNAYKQFGEKQINDWHNTRTKINNGKVESGGTTLPIPIKEGETPELLDRWLLIRGVFERYLNQENPENGELISEEDIIPENLTPEALFGIVFPRALEVYKKTYEETQDPVKCLQKVGGYPVNEKGSLVTNTLASNMLLSTVLQKKIPLKDLDPAKARLELEVAHVHRQQLETVQKAVLNGNLSVFKKLISSSHKQLVLFGNGTPKWKPLAWEKLKPLILKNLFGVIEKQAFARIEMPNGESVPVEILLKIIENSPDLQVLKLGNCPLLNSTHLSRILELCPCLTVLSLSNMPKLGGDVGVNLKNLKLLKLEKTGLTSLALETPSLQYLICPDNLSLTKIQNINTVIRQMDVSRCVELETLQNEEFSTCSKLETFKVEGAIKMKHVKELIQAPYLISLIHMPYEFAIQQLAENFKSKKKELCFKALKLSLKQAKVFKLWQREFKKASSKKSPKYLEKKKIKKNYSEEELKKTESHLRYLLEDISETVQEKAADSLINLGVASNKVISTLMKALEEDKDKSVRSKAARVLGELGDASKEVIRGLLKALNEDNSEDVRGFAAQALGKLGVASEEVISVLLKALEEDKDKSVRSKAARVLGELGDANKEVIRGLLKALNEDNSEDVRRSAAQALGKLGVASEEVISVLLKALNEDKDEDVRLSSAMALGLLGFANEVVINTLVNAAMNYNGDKIVWILCGLGIASDQVIRSLLKILNYKYDYLKKNAVRGLGILGVASNPVISMLLKILNEDKNGKLQCEAVQALGELGVASEPVINAILKALIESNYENLQVSAVCALAKLGVANEKVINALTKAQIENKRESVKFHATRALGMLGVKNKETEEALRQDLKNTIYQSPEAYLGLIACGEEIQKHTESLWQIVLVSPSVSFCWKALEHLVTLKEIPASVLIKAKMLDEKNPASRVQQAMCCLGEQCPSIFTEKLKYFLNQSSKYLEDNQCTMNVRLQRISQGYLRTKEHVNLLQPDAITPEIFVSMTQQNLKYLSEKKSEYSGIINPNKIKQEQLISPSKVPQSIFYFSGESTDLNLHQTSLLNSKRLLHFARNDMSGKLQHQNQTIHFNFELQEAAGEGDCAVIASPFAGRNEICKLLWKAVEQPQNCEKLQAEIREAIINEKFLLEEDQKTLENFEIQQLPYHEAHGIYQMTVKEIQKMLSEESIKTGLLRRFAPRNDEVTDSIQNDELKDIDLLNFLENKTEYAEEYQELSQLKLACEDQQQIFNKIEIERQQFLSSSSVCQSYIKIIVANEKQWIGKGTLFLAAKEKNVNLCIWQEQENSDELKLDEDYSYLGNPLPQFHHVVYRHGAIHYDLLIEKPLELTNTNVKQTNEITIYRN